MSDPYLAGVVWRLLNTTEASTSDAPEPATRPRRLRGLLRRVARWSSPQ